MEKAWVITPYDVTRDLPICHMNQPKRPHLIMLGAGHAHLQVIKQWAASDLPEVDITLISPHPVQTYSGMIPGWVAGTYPLELCSIDIRPWLESTGIRWVEDQAVRLDPDHKQIFIRSKPNEAIDFDFISIDIGSSMSLAQLERLIPGASGRVLPIRPMDQFVKYWQIALEMASNRRLDISIVGAGAAGVEVALACRAKLHSINAKASVSLLTGSPGGLLNIYPKRVQVKAREALQAADVTVLPHRCTRLEDGAIVLENGLRLNCDLPIIATGAMAPEWLTKTGLALDENGYILVNSHQQSVSHAHVFACGDIATRSDLPHAKSGVYAVRAGEAMGDQLLAAIQGADLSDIQVRKRSLNLLNTANRRAIASYGPFCSSGWLMWQLKNFIDKRYIRSFQKPPTRNKG